MKTLLYWRYTTRSLARGGQRTLLAVFCVAVGVLAIVAIQLVINAIDAGVSANARQINGGDVVVASEAAPLNARQLTVLDRLMAAGTITAYGAVDAQEMQVRESVGTRLRLLAVDPARFPLAGGAVVTAPEGGHLSSLLRGMTVVVTTHLAQRLNLAVGQSLHFSAVDGRAGTATVGGIVASAGVLQGSLMLIARDAYARLPSALGQPITYTGLYVDVPGDTAARAADVAGLLRRAFQLATVTTTRETLAGYRSEIATGRTFVQIVGLLALLIGGVGIMNTMQVALKRRRTEIAMLKAMGYRRRDLYALFGLEAALIGLAGGLIGTAAGSGVSLLIKGTMEELFGILWPTVVDARTLTAGIALGAGTALIFGLWPIVQAAELRPQAVLRGLAEDASRASRRRTAVLAVLLALLFVALAAGILGNVRTALSAVGGIGVALAMLSLICATAVAIVGTLRVPDAIRARTLAPVGLAILLAAGATAAIPAVGVLLLIATALVLLVMLLPSNWRWAVRLALRRIGRQRTRTVATLLVLCVGVFAVGLVLTLSQDIKTAFTQRYLRQPVDVAVAVVGRGNRAVVARLLAGAPGMRNEVIATVSHTQPVAVAGRAFGPVARAALATGRYRADQLIGPFSGVQGHDLASHHPPDPEQFTLVRGAHDRHVGRTLTVGDAGTRNALLPVDASGAPLNLRLGDTVTVAGPSTTRVTVMIVGFYTSSLFAAPIQVDDGVVGLVANGHPTYLFGAYLNPDTANATLYRIQHAVPAAQVYSLADADALAQVTAILNNVTLVLVVIASLALFAGMLLIANTVALALLERRRELGILKAVGYTSRGVLGAVLIENGAVGVTGALLAMLLVAAATPIVGRAMYNHPFGVQIPVMLAAIPVAAIVCMAVAAAVAWGATRVRPLEVLRYE